MKIAELRIKRKTLAAEARIIKDAEQRALRKARRRLGTNKPSEASYDLYNRFREHRVTVVRNAARAAHLADAYLRNRPYATVEDPKHRTKPITSPIWTDIQKTLKTFGGPELANVTFKDVYAWTRGEPTLMQKAATEAGSETAATPAA
jgi:ElaB/YqjD/DUF883 family membrane-anchored ribosome-binding protein